MRTWNHLLWSCVASLALMAAGCKDGGGSADGGADLAAGNDLTQGARPTSGPLVFTEISGRIPLNNVLTDVRLLSPIITFRDVNTPVVTPDYTQGLIGCTGDHYDTTTNDLPGPSANGGTVRITGFRSVTPVTGTASYNEINCQLNTGTGQYDCGYGPVTSGNIGPNTSTSPIVAAASDPLQASDRITFESAGAGNFGSFPVAANSTAPVALDTISADLSTVTYTPNQDTVINFTCAGGSCSGVVAVNIDVSRNTPDQVTAPSQTFGHITCTAFLLANTTSVTIRREAINAMRGCNSQGTNCDTALQSVRTVLVRLSSPVSTQDSRQNSISNIVAGQGIFYAGALQ